MTNPTNPESTVAETTPTGYSNQREENRRVIAAYRYRSAGDHWDAIKEFVQTSANLVADESKAMLKLTLSMLSQFALWAYQRGLPLTHHDDILTSANLRRFAEENMAKYTPSSYQLRLRHIRHIIRRVGDHDPNYPRQAKNKDYLAERKIYLERDQIEFVSSCNSRPTAWQRSNFRVYISLGFGAGLSCKELNDVRAGDILIENGRWVVRVPGDNARTVPIRHDWVSLLRKGLEGREPGDYAILGYRHPELPERLPIEINLAAPSQPHPNPSTMRSTWIVEHLTRGLRPDVLAEIAGIKKVESIRIYVQRMPDYDLDSYLDQIVGGDL